MEEQEIISKLTANLGDDQLQGTGFNIRYFIQLTRDQGRDQERERWLGTLWALFFFFCIITLEYPNSVSLLLFTGYIKVGVSVYRDT